jgi:lipopolysaccharide transport system permease protein
VNSPAPSSKWAHYRDFFWLLVRRDLKVRYGGASLGALWNLIHPVVLILVYVVIFSSIFGQREMPRAGVAGASFAVHLCSGILIWLVFADVLTRSVGTLVDNRNFLQKVAFPPLLLHASVLFNVLLIYFCGVVILWLVLAAMGQAPPWSWLWAFPLMVLVGLAASGLGMLLSAYNVFFRDTAQIVQVLLQIGFWFNPIVYPKRILANSSFDPPFNDLTILLRLNPIEDFISIVQDKFGSIEAMPESYAWYVVGLFPIACLAIGLIAFRRLLPEVRDAL